MTNYVLGLSPDYEGTIRGLYFGKLNDKVAQDVLWDVDVCLSEWIVPIIWRASFHMLENRLLYEIDFDAWFDEYGIYELDAHMQREIDRHDAP